MTKIPSYMRTVLTPKQYVYYTDYCYNNKTLWQISIENDVHISTVCRVIKNARRRLVNFYERKNA